MFKKIVLLLTERICTCQSNEVGYGYEVNNKGLYLECRKCGKILQIPADKLKTEVRIIPVVKGGAKIISLEEAKKEKEEGGIVDGIVC